MHEYINEGYIGLSIEAKGGGRRYSHSGAMMVDADLRIDLNEKEKKAYKELLEEISDQLKELSVKFEKQGYAEIEYQSSEEVLKENFDANDIEFDASGNVV